MGSEGTRVYSMVTGGGFPSGRKSAKSSDCIECGSCELHCPQQIKIIETHKEVVRLFE